MRWPFALWQRPAYYTLVASLPPLPARFDRARELPISPERLERRLTMLAPEDAAIARLALDFLIWQRQPADRTDAEVVAHYERILARVEEEPILRAMIEFRMTLRTVMAALRRRRMGLPPP